MPDRSGFARARERYAAAKTFIGLFSEFRQTLDWGDRKPDTNGIGTLLAVLCAVMIGHQENRPMNASKIALYVNIPRTTVLRKLELLIELGAVERHGDVYRIAPGRAQNAPVNIGRVARVLHEAVAVIDKRQNVTRR